MPRRKKTDLKNDDGSNLLNEIYIDMFAMKTISMNVLRNISKEIDYTNKEEVLQMLPMVQKQMEIYQKNNDTLLLIEDRLSKVRANNEED